MKNLLRVLCGCAVLMFTGAAVPAADGERVLTQQEQAFYASSIVPALHVIKRSLPSAPEGWAREAETAIEAGSSGIPASDIEGFHFTYTVSYRRTAGVGEETAKLHRAAEEVLKRNNDEAEAQLRDLMSKQADTEKDIRKAQQSKETGRERRLRKQLGEIQKSIGDVPQERDRKIREETDPLLVRDTVLEVSVTVNESFAEYPDLRSFTRPKAAFALRKDGEREGSLGWKPGRTVILYGDWQEVKNNSFRLRREERPLSPRAQSILIAITGDRTRAEQFLKRTDLRSILELMK